MAESTDVLEQLRDIRLPPLSDAGIAADWAAGCAVGLLIALLAALLARAVARTPRPRRKTALAKLAASRVLEPTERLFALARLLRELGAERRARTGESDSGEQAGDDWPGRFGRRLGTDFFSGGAGVGLREALYRRDPGVDPEAVDRELERLFNRFWGRFWGRLR